MKRGAKSKAALDLIDEHIDLKAFEDSQEDNILDPDPDDEPEVTVTANRYDEIPDYEEY